MEGNNRISQGYVLYNRLDVVYKYSSRGLPMPSPVSASTDEEPTSRIDQHLRYHPPMMPWDDLKLHSPSSFAFPGLCRVPQPNIIATGTEKGIINNYK
jgi:hypothetical protein